MTMTLGPDWPSLRAFGLVVAVVVLAGPVLGRAVAGPVGIIVGAGLAAFTCLTGAHLAATRRARRTGTPLGYGDGLAVDSAVSNTRHDNGSAAGRRRRPRGHRRRSPGPVEPRSAGGSGRVGVGLRRLPAGRHCQRCRRPEAVQLAAVHDTLHHGARRTAQALRAARCAHSAGTACGAAQRPE